MEANNHAFQATPHKCDAPTNGHYNYCDRGGLDKSTREKKDMYGPGSEFTIDTRGPFTVRTEFPAHDGTLKSMRTVLQQAGRQVVLEHSEDDAEYFAALSDTMAAGMSLRITYWGDEAETMAWMDSPPCGDQACSGAAAGKATISNITIGRLPKEELGSTKLRTTGGTTRAPIHHATGHDLSISGLSSSVLAGSGGSIRGDELTVSHGAGLTLFSEFSGHWEPDDIAQLKLLGHSISFSVDLSAVSCACNLAFYLIAAPPLDWNGKPSRGTERDGQPPYYCDANMVGGQWCPEIDIMEANNHAFQATPHKCDAPVNGHYESCDRGGLDKSTRDTLSSYGPGPDFIIDTRKPFVVRTDFPQHDGTLVGMRTVLQQADRQVVLDRGADASEYLAALSDIMSSGMSLRITYWGDKAETMAWMDSPPCGSQTCSGAAAGSATISNITVRKLPPNQVTSDHHQESKVWVVSNPADSLFEHVVPEGLINDADHFVSLGDVGVVQWKGASHYVERSSKPPSSTRTNEEIVLTDFSSTRSTGYTNTFVKKFAQLPQLDKTPKWFPVTVLLMGAALTMLLLALLAIRRHRKQSTNPGSGAVTEAVAAPDRSAAMAHALGPIQGSSDGSDAAIRRFLPRSGSSCAQLLTIGEAS